jgi:hypothetical protein
MKTTEKILCITFLFGLILKLALIPGSGILITLSLLILSILYFYLGFAFFNNIPFKGIFKKDSYREIKPLRILGAIAAGIVLSTISIGLLFKIQNWPLASSSLIVGLITSFIILAITTFKSYKTKDIYYSRILKRLIPAIILTGFFLLVSDLSFVKFQYRNHPDYIKAYMKLQNDPTNDSLRENLYLEDRKVFMDSVTFRAYKEYLDQHKEK